MLASEPLVPMVRLLCIMSWGANLAKGRFDEVPNDFSAASKKKNLLFALSVMNLTFLETDPRLKSGAVLLASTLMLDTSTSLTAAAVLLTPMRYLGSDAIPNMSLYPKAEALPVVPVVLFSIADPVLESFSMVRKASTSFPPTENGLTLISLPAANLKDPSKAFSLSCLEVLRFTSVSLSADTIADSLTLLGSTFPA